MDMGSGRWAVILAGVLCGVGIPIDSAAQGPPPDPARRAKLLQKFDIDGDGKLSASEMEAAHAARGDAKRNGANRPDGQGRAKPAGPGPELKHDAAMQRILEQFDRDGDRTLSLGEMADLRAARRAGAVGHANGGTAGAPGVERHE